MSYCSENKLPLSTPISRLIEVIDLLGYVRIQDGLKIENEIASFMWFGNDERISFVGIELDVFKKPEYISVQTRTREGCSYWDLEHQNKTISLLKSIFQGSFTTDEGSNKYMKLEEPMPSRLACALFKARWIYHNEMLKPLIYLNSRDMTGNIVQNEPTGLQWIDEMNPRLISNNMIVPYIVGCWESYFRNSFIALLKYAKDVPDNAVKKCRVSNADLLRVIRQQNDLPSILADSLSFQRPSIISGNFHGINDKIDIASWLKKSYRNRKVNLFDSITALIDIRDCHVHTASILVDLTDEKIRKIITDLNAAVDRVYDGLGQVYEFEPSHSF